MVGVTATRAMCFLGTSSPNVSPGVRFPRNGGHPVVRLIWSSRLSPPWQRAEATFLSLATVCNVSTFSSLASMGQPPAVLLGPLVCVVVRVSAGTSLPQRLFWWRDQLVWAVLYLIQPFFLGLIKLVFAASFFLTTTSILESFVSQENHFVLTARAAKSG